MKCIEQFTTAEVMRTYDIYLTVSCHDVVDHTSLYTTWYLLCLPHSSVYIARTLPYQLYGTSMLRTWHLFPRLPIIQESWPLMQHEIYSIGTLQIDWHELEAKLNAVEGVQDVHDLHVWSISSSNCAMTVHIKVRTCLFLSIFLFLS